MKKNLGKGFCGGWAGTPGFFVLFFFPPPRPTEAPYIWLAVCFCISIWTNNVGPSDFGGLRARSIHFQRESHLDLDVLTREGRRSSEGRARGLFVHVWQLVSWCCVGRPGCLSGSRASPSQMWSGALGAVCPLYGLYVHLHHRVVGASVP